ncbi:DNA (cytosine-5-)-methyltransferase [Thalassobium sp. R2A62]|uniref:DNA (cytosine-5-)-methyltransferase n=1 Tax=Thalassobium sp. R2A62 TaxID=633131 RepID=UPI0001B1CCA5|nr:DNA (cytosine-5-)-methyltransferase [Thalassobium sp. R2A62]EET47730.1 cytosine-specific methyltransferase NlaX [Thalassobium sp. R2A62]
MLDRLNSVAKSIHEKRTAMGLTQGEFAGLLGLGSSGERTVGGWERGEHVPTRAKLEKIFNLPDIIPFRSPYDGKKAKPDFRFIDLFAGIGGIRMPFQELGGHCVFSSEWDKFSQKSYAANYGEVPQGDITQIAANDIPEHDLLLAGFPCQAFSQAGLKQGFNDTRGTMFFEIQRVLAHHRPKAFLLENVKQLRGHDKGRTLNTILSILRGEEGAVVPENVPMSEEARKSLSTPLNYRVDFEVLAAKNFGVPQNRERVYIVGFDRDQVSEAEARDLPREILDGLKERKSETRLGDVLETNASVDPKFTISDRLLAGHERRLRAHRAKGNGFGFSLFNAESPYCNTISARYYKDGSEVLIDQSDIGKNPRKLTPRECARIQGFPEEFNVGAVSNVQNYRQFGNSVSVPVIRAIAEEMAPYLKV